MKTNAHYFTTNKATWNAKVPIHAESEFYNLKAFKNGKCSLMPYELKALGNVNGKRLLHLQCHFGQDTLSWARRGAHCVGVDISDVGIRLARTLNDELSLDAKFVCCNVLETSTVITTSFDIVFTSYGVIGWLPDLQPWANMIAERLQPGGEFYMVEFHPIVWMFNYTKKPPELEYHYKRQSVIYESYTGTYADENASIQSEEYGWNHGLSTVVNALINAGLHITYLNEHEESPYNIFPGLVKTSQGLYKMQNGLYPLIFELKATKPSNPPNVV